MCSAQFSWQYLGKWRAKIECVRHDISPKQCHYSVQGVSSELWSHSNSNYHCIWWAEQCIQPKAYQNYTYNNSSQELRALQSLKEEPTNLNPNLELQPMMVFVPTRQIIRLVYTIVRLLLLCSPMLGTVTVSTVTSACIVPWHHKQKPFPFNLLVTSSKRLSHCLCFWGCRAQHHCGFLKAQIQLGVEEDSVYHKRQNYLKNQCIKHWKKDSRHDRDPQEQVQPNCCPKNLQNEEDGSQFGVMFCHHSTHHPSLLNLSMPSTISMNLSDHQWELTYTRP